jgi:hypothetical protein
VGGRDFFCTARVWLENSVLLVLNGPTRIVSLKRIYPGFQKYLGWFFFAKRSPWGSFSVEDGQCLNSQ